MTTLIQLERKYIEYIEELEKLEVQIRDNIELAKKLYRHDKVYKYYERIIETKKEIRAYEKELFRIHMFAVSKGD